MLISSLLFSSLLFSSLLIVFHPRIGSKGVQQVCFGFLSFFDLLQQAMFSLDDLIVIRIVHVGSFLVDLGSFVDQATVTCELPTCGFGWWWRYETDPTPILDDQDAILAWVG